MSVNCGWLDRVPAPFPLTADVLTPLLGKNVQLIWEVPNSVSHQLHYPLTPTDRVSREEAYYDIRLEWSPNYIDRSGESIDGFTETKCRCGAELGIEDENAPFYSSFITSTCPACGKPVDVSNWPGAMRDLFTGDEYILLGAAASRFAVVVDCGKAFPSDSPIKLNPRLKALIEDILQCTSYEVGDFY